jgi:hypothetical protein
MRGIAKLLFGGDGDGVGQHGVGQHGDELSGLLAGDDGWWRAADRVRRSGEWCGSTPGSDPAAGPGGARPVSRHVSPWDFRSR